MDCCFDCCYLDGRLLNITILHKMTLNLNDEYCT